MPPKVQIGLIGLGRHGTRYAKHLLEDIPEGELVAVCKRTAFHGEMLGSKSKISLYHDYRELIHDSRVEAVVVVTPPELTREICLEAVKSHKPLLVEKPLAPTGPMAREMVQAASAEAVPIMTAQTLRFDPIIQAFKQSLPTVGDPFYLLLHLRLEPKSFTLVPPPPKDPCGVMLELGIHLVDLVRFLTGEDIQEVQCRMGETENSGPGSFAFATIFTTSGLPCLINVSRLGVGRIGRVEWIGKKGQLVGDWATRKISTLSNDNRWHETDIPPRPTVQATLQYFIDSLLKKKPMVISGLDGQRAVEVVDACYQSAAQGSIPITLSTR